MEVRADFRKTEVGVIPDDWLLVSYDNVFDFLTAATYSRAQLSENDEIGYVHYGDIHTKCLHFLDLDKIKLPSIKDELLKNYPLIKDGDIIMADASEDYEGVGKSVEVRNLKNRRAISGLHTFLLRDKNENIADGFKGYIHSNKLVKKQMDTLASGLKVYGVSKTNLKLIKIPLPPTHAEQTAIATALNDADALITQLEKLIAKKRATKQGAMQELLKPKEGWKIEPLEKYVSITSGKSPSNFSFKDYGVPYFKVEQMNNSDKFILETPYHFNTNNAIPKGSIIFPKRGASIFLNKIRILKEDSYMDTNLMTLTVNDHLNNEYLFYQLSFIGLANLADTTSIPQINNKHINPFLIPMPFSKDEQEGIAQILTDMDAEIEVLEKKLEKTKKIRQGMMQELLTGRIRLV